jgi:hypothetical protein
VEPDFMTIALRAEAPAPVLDPALCADRFEAAAEMILSQDWRSDDDDVRRQAQLLLLIARRLRRPVAVVPEEAAA